MLALSCRTAPEGFDGLSPHSLCGMAAKQVAILGAGMIGDVHRRAAVLAGAQVLGVMASSPERSRELPEPGESSRRTEASRKSPRARRRSCTSVRRTPPTCRTQWL